MAEIKFCGLTRPEDARAASEVGAAYAGVIFAGGPRRVIPDVARAVLDHAGGARRVGVFGTQGTAEVERVARAVGLDVVQLHADPTPEVVRAARAATGAQVWAVVRLAGGVLPGGIEELAAAADAIVLDARVEGQLGGTGVSLAWESLALPPAVARLVLAGGLTPDNVARGIRALRPEIVDVSSGVERSPGIKDEAAMRAFAAAVRSVPA